MDISKGWKLRDFEKKVTKTLLANDAVEFIVSTKNQYTQLTDKKKARKFLETAKEKIEGLLSDFDKL